MTNKSARDQAVRAATICGSGGVDHSATARAQTELIEILARLVLVEIEREQQRVGASQSSPFGSAAGVSRTPAVHREPRT